MGTTGLNADDLKRAWPNGAMRRLLLQINTAVDELVAAKLDTTGKNAADGYVGLDSSGKITTGLPWTVVTKTTTETRASTTTLANDAALKFPMLANTKYRFRMYVYFQTGATPDFKFRHSGPASPTLMAVHRTWTQPGGTAFSGVAVDSAYSVADVSPSGANTGVGRVYLEGIIHNGANAGDFVFQWAQNTSDAGNTSVLAGSSVEYSAV